MITERTLRKWRVEALVTRNAIIFTQGLQDQKMEMCGRILRLTQELLDQHLLRKEKKAK